MIFNTIGAIAQSFGGGGGNADENFDDVVLLLHFDGADNSQQFFDRSKYAHRGYSFGGTPKLTTTSPKFGTACLDLNGSADFRYPANPNFILTGAFTIEFWMKSSTGPTQYDSPLSCYGNNDDPGNWVFFLKQDGSNEYISFWWSDYNGGVGPCVESTTDVIDGSWHHIAVTYDGSNVRMFVDGTLEDTQANTENAAARGVSELWIGNQQSTPTRQYQGQLDDLRITAGTARYTASFTAPEEAFPDDGADEFFDNVVLRMTMDGTNGGSYFQDYSTWYHEISNPNSHTTVTPVKKYGSASLSLPGSGGGLSTPTDNNAAFAINDDPFTIDCWVRPNIPAVTGDPDYIWSCRSPSGGVSLSWESGGGVQVYFASGVSPFTTAPYALPTSNFTHLRLEGTGNPGTVTLYADGSPIGSTPVSSPIANGDVAFTVGNAPTSPAGQLWNGYIDDVMVMIGANATYPNPPTAAQPISGGTETYDTFVYRAAGTTDFVAPATGTYAVFVVDGGGGSVNDGGGGGGSGQIVASASVPLTASSPYTVVVGAGGAGVVTAPPTVGGSGGPSYFNPGPAQVGPTGVGRGAYGQPGSPGAPVTAGGPGGSGGGGTSSPGSSPLGARYGASIGGSNGSDHNNTSTWSPQERVNGGTGQGPGFATAISTINTYLPERKQVSAGAGGFGGRYPYPYGPPNPGNPGQAGGSGGGGGGVVFPGMLGKNGWGQAGQPRGAGGGVGVGGGGGGGPGNSPPRAGGSGEAGGVIIIGPI